MRKYASEYTYLLAYNLLKNGLIPVTTTECKDLESPSSELILKSDTLSQEKQLLKKEAYDRLSNEAKEVIDLIINSPDEILQLFITPKRRLLSCSLLKQILSDSWKSKFIVEEVFQEIKRWVENF